MGTVSLPSRILGIKIKKVGAFNKCILGILGVGGITPL